MKELPTMSAFGVLELVNLARAYHIAARLNIGDLLAERPQTAEELAERTATHPRSLYRILRALAAFNVFAENERGEFELTPAGELLRNDVVGSIRNWFMLGGLVDECLEARGKTLDVVKTGQDGFRLAHGKCFYELIREPGHEALRESFVLGMSNWTTWQCKVVVASYSFMRFKKMVDVAGGQGKLIAEILLKNPEMRGVLYDQPFSVDMAKKGFADAGVADRCEFVGGSIFDSVPAGADGYLLKHVLRDWSDEESIRILRNIEKAMLPGGTLFVLDGVIDPRNGVDRLQKLIDIEQMFYLTGRMRTQKEWDTLFDAAGFQRKTTVKTPVVDMVIMVVRRKNERTV